MPSTTIVISLYKILSSSRMLAIQPWLLTIQDIFLWLLYSLWDPNNPFLNTLSSHNNDTWLYSYFWILIYSDYDSHYGHVSLIFLSSSKLPHIVSLSVCLPCSCADIRLQELQLQHHWRLDFLCYWFNWWWVDHTNLAYFEVNSYQFHLPLYYAQLMWVVKIKC